MKSVINLLYSWICFVFFTILTIIGGIISLLSLIFNPGGDISFYTMKGWAKIILWFCRIKVTVWGLENINKEITQIFASNHLSHLDILLLSSIIPVKFGWIAKKELFKLPIIGWHMKANNYIAVDRENTKKALQSFYKSAEKIKNGSRVAIFPEGTRSREGELQPFKKGVFHLCARTGVPIVPIYIDGTYEALLPDTFRVHPSKVYVNIGKEIKTTGNTKGSEIKTLMNDLRESIINLQSDITEYKKSSNTNRSLFN
ncbi:MAG: lysophospholipid acyltransferase family protein [Spirochaetota bacterium]|nr:lysophospholipid acyltransferase family protein [Spirochaetota bacterium]